jgi:hypothetical protein
MIVCCVGVKGLYERILSLVLSMSSKHKNRCVFKKAFKVAPYGLVFETAILVDLSERE